MTVPKAIEALRRVFPERDVLALSESENYKEVNRSYHSSIQSELDPAVIFLLNDKDDIFKYVKPSNYPCSSIKSNFLLVVEASSHCLGVRILRMASQ